MEEVFPEALRQRCLAHRVRNVTEKVGNADHAQGKADVQAAYYASSQDVARVVAEAVVKKWQAKYPSAMASFWDDFEACLAYLRCPVNHHKYIRTTNLPKGRLRRSVGGARRPYISSKRKVG